MTINRFNILLKNLEGLAEDKNVARIYRKHLNKPAREYNTFVIDYIKNRKYPRREGASNDEDPTREPGPHLYEQQRYGIRKVRNKPDLRVTFFNRSPIAPFFFRKVKPHKIEVKRAKALSFLWQNPWFPLDGRGEGPRVFDSVDHPGTLGYEDLIAEEFRPFRKKFSKAIENAGRELTNLGK